jgi:hypothetical protein
VAYAVRRIRATQESRCTACSVIIHEGMQAYYVPRLAYIYCMRCGGGDPGAA